MTEQQIAQRGVARLDRLKAQLADCHSILAIPPSWKENLEARCKCEEAKPIYEEIIAALTLLEPVAAGTHKIVPEGPTREQIREEIRAELLNEALSRCDDLWPIATEE